MQARALAADSFKVLREGEKRRQSIAVRTWLSAILAEDDQEFYANTREIFPNTGKWLLKKQTVLSWMNPGDHALPMRWMTGIPGSGKTTLASLLVAEVRKIENSATIFFYCRNRDSQRDSLISILRSLIQQLIHGDEDLIELVDAKASTSGQSSLSNLALAKELFEVALQQCNTVFIILDGIDECQKVEKKKVLTYFMSLHNKFHSNDDQLDDLQTACPPAIKTFFISQDDNDCGKTLRRLPTMKISPQDHESDLEAYCGHWEDKILEKHPKLRLKSTHIAAEVCAASEGKKRKHIYFIREPLVF